MLYQNLPGEEKNSTASGNLRKPWWSDLHSGNGLRGLIISKSCLWKRIIALTGDWVDMNSSKVLMVIYNTKSQMDCFAEKMLGIKNTIPADIEDGYYVQGIIEAMMNSTQSRTWHKVSDYIIK